MNSVVFASVRQLQDNASGQHRRRIYQTKNWTNRNLTIKKRSTDKRPRLKYFISLADQRVVAFISIRWKSLNRSPYFGDTWQGPTSKPRILAEKNETAKTRDAAAWMFFFRTPLRAYHRIIDSFRADASFFIFVFRSFSIYEICLNETASRNNL